MAAVIGGLNGAIGGWHRIYRWRSLGGVVAFVLDSTWAIVTSAGALLVHAVALAQPTRGGYLPELSERRDRHVYSSGLTPRRGFLTTVGNVVSGAGRTRRRDVVEIHEHAHVWQARWLGPLYPLLYLVWTVLGALLGVAAWALRGRRERLRNVVDTTAYYSNPLEWWAYSREGRWPPPGAISGLTWSQPIRVSRGTLPDT